MTERENPAVAGVPVMPARSTMRRRDFLSASGAAAGLALLEGCARREQLLFEQAIERSDPAPGVTVWRPSVCGQCAAGCGVLVRVVGGDAKKIEGNPEHPVNRGGVCALGHSALQELYNPDRITVPMRRSKPRAEAGGAASDFEPIPWARALEELAAMVAGARERGPGAIAVLSRDDEVVGALWRRFAVAIGGAPVFAWRSADEEVEREAARRVFGIAPPLYYDLAEADFVLGLGAAFLDRWRSPVHYARALVEMRRRSRGRLIQAESRMSLTGAAADRWLPVRPGSEGVLARALAGALLDGGRVESANAARYRQLFPDPPPSLEAAAATCDIAVARLRSLVRELAAAERPLVIVGGSAGAHAGGLANVVAGLGLDILLGAVGRRGGVLPGAGFAIAAAIEPEGPWLARVELPEQLAAAELLLVSECDPLHDLPAESAAAQAIARVPRRVALASFFDDTSLGADLILPLQTDFERLQVVSPRASSAIPVLGLANPVIATRGEGRHPGDIVLALAATQSGLAVEFAWKGMDEVAEHLLASAAGRLPGAEGVPPKRFLQLAFERGGVWPETASSPRAPGAVEIAVAAQESVAPFVEPQGAPNPEDGMLVLILFESVKTGDGRGANRPWLQELPDPLASVMWGTWIEVAPVDAERLGVVVGDRVRVASAAGEVEAWLVISPASRPGCVAMPVGGGHRDYGRYARDRGASVTALLGVTEVDGVGVPAMGSAVVRIAKMPASGRPAILGRGLRGPEQIPRGWGAHEPVARRPVSHDGDREPTGSGEKEEGP